MADFDYEDLAKTAGGKIKHHLEQANGCINSYSNSGEKKFDQQLRLAGIWVEVLKACRSHDLDPTLEAIEAIRRSHTS